LRKLFPHPRSIALADGRVGEIGGGDLQSGAFPQAVS
jgi:hypothetical protein